MLSERGKGGVVMMADGWRLGKGHTVPLGTAEGEDVQFTENPCLRAVEDSSAVARQMCSCSGQDRMKYWRRAASLKQKN